MQLQQFIPYFRQSISQFIRLSSQKDHQENIDIVSKNLILLTKYEMFLEVAFHVLTQHAQTNSNYQNVLISNLIKDKFKYEFQTIPAQNLNFYYKELTTIFHSNMQTSRAFYNNIELSLAYMFISIIPHNQESIQNYLSSIIPQYQQLDKSAQADHYVKVLGFISSEIQDNRFVIDENSRQKARNYLINNQKHILIILNDGCPKLWENYHVEKENIIQTFACWITLNYDQVIYQCLPQHFLTDKMFQLLLDDETIQTGVQCIKSIVMFSKSYKENHDLLDLFLHKMRNQLARQAQKSILKKQFSVAQSYVEVIIIISKKLYRKFVQEIQQYYIFIKTIVELSLYKSIDLTNTIIQFWQGFFDQIYAYIHENSSENLEKFQVLAIFCYQRLLYKCQFTKAEIQKLQVEEQSYLKKLKQIFNTRNDCQDLLISISRVLTITEYVNLVACRINQEINKQIIQWSKIQVYYFSLLIKSIQDYQQDESNDNANKIAQLNSYYYELVQKQNLPINYDNRYYIPIAIKRTFLKFIKSIIKIKNINQNIVRFAARYSQINFSNSLLSYHAERAFARICEVKSHVFEDDIEDIINILERYPLKPYIISGVYNIICQKSETIEQYLYKTFENTYTTIQKRFHSHKQNGQLIICLISASRVFLQIKIIQNHLQICKSIYKMLWPFIQNALINPQNVQDDSDIGIERMAKLLKFFMRCLKDNFSEFLIPLLQSIKIGYSQYPVCSYIYIFQVIVPLFSSSTAHESLLLEFYKFLCRQTINYFNSKYKDIERYILLLQDFIGMNKKFFMCNASLVSKSQMFQEILNICYYFIFHQNINVSRAAYSYFQAIFMVYWRKQFILDYNQEFKDKSQIFAIQNQQYMFYNKFKQVLLPHIPDLLIKAFYHLSQCPPQVTRQYILECILSEIKAFNIENLQVWAKVFNDFPSQIMLYNQKQEFFKSLSSLNDQNIIIINKAIESTKRLLLLISKRYVYAYKRTNIKLYPS